MAHKVQLVLLVKMVLRVQLVPKARLVPLVPRAYRARQVQAVLAVGIWTVMAWPTQMKTSTATAITMRPTAAVPLAQWVVLVLLVRRVLLVSLARSVPLDQLALLVRLVKMVLRVRLVPKAQLVPLVLRAYPARRVQSVLAVGIWTVMA